MHAARTKTRFKENDHQIFLLEPCYIDLHVTTPEINLKINTFTHMLVEGSEAAKKLEQMLVDALKYAASSGLVATIEQKALPVLAMGNHEPQVIIAATKEYGMMLEVWYKSHEKILVDGVRTVETEIETFVRSPEIPTLVNKIESIAHDIEQRVESVGSEIASAIKKEFTK